MTKRQTCWTINKLHLSEMNIGKVSMKFYRGHLNMGQIRNRYTKYHHHISMKDKLHRLAFRKYLFVTNIVSSGTLMGLGDLIEQEIEFRYMNRNDDVSKRRYDKTRLKQMIVMGFVSGMYHHHIYICLYKLYPRRNLKNIIKKILIDEFIATPIYICSFFYFIGYMTGTSHDHRIKNIKNKFGEVYIVDWVLNVPTQTVNFYFLPVQYQAFYNILTDFVLNIFLSYIQHRD